MLSNSVDFWRTYLNKSVSQRDEVASVRSMKSPVTKIKKEYDEPVSIFLACEYLQNDDIDTIATDNLHFECDKGEFKSEIFVKPSIRTSKKRRIKIPGSCEICFKG